MCSLTYKTFVVYRRSPYEQKLSLKLRISQKTRRNKKDIFKMLRMTFKAIQFCYRVSRLPTKVLSEQSSDRGKLLIKDKE